MNWLRSPTALWRLLLLRIACCANPREARRWRGRGDGVWERLLLLLLLLLLHIGEAALPLDLDLGLILRPLQIWDLGLLHWPLRLWKGILWRLLTAEAHQRAGLRVGRVEVARQNA